MRGFCLMLLRVCPAAWVGAAALFVLVTIGVARSSVESDVVMQLTPVRFSYFYPLEFGMLGTAVVLGWVGIGYGDLGRLRGFIGWGLLLLALATAIGDFLWIYRPLEEMMRTRTLTENFRVMHEGSKHINSTIVTITAIAALLINWPGKVNRAT